MPLRMHCCSGLWRGLTDSSSCCIEDRGGNRKKCGGADNATGNCLDYAQMHMEGGEKAIWYTPGDYQANHRKGPATPSQTYASENCHQADIDGDVGSCSGLHPKGGTINRNAPAGTEIGCFEGPRSMHAAGPERGNVGGGWSSDGKTGASLISSQKQKGLQSGLRHFDVPTRCQMYNFASRSIIVGTRCGEQLPFAVRVGFFGDITVRATPHTIPHAHALLESPLACIYCLS